MKSEFKRGDVLARLLRNGKWVVMNARGAEYELVSLDPEDQPFSTKFLEKPFAECKYVKVGRWNFDSEREVDDDD